MRAFGPGTGKKEDGHGPSKSGQDVRPGKSKTDSKPNNSFGYSNICSKGVTRQLIVPANAPRGTKVETQLNSNHVTDKANVANALKAKIPDHLPNAQKFRKRVGVRWTVYPSTPPAFINDETGKSGSVKTNTVHYEKAFPPRQWPYGVLLSTRYNVQSDNEIASSVVSQGLRVFFPDDFKYILRRGVIVDRHTKSGINALVLAYSYRVSGWLERMLIPSGGSINLPSVRLKYGHTGSAPVRRNVDDIKSIPITVMKFPRSPEYVNLQHDHLGTVYVASTDIFVSSSGIQHQSTIDAFHMVTAHMLDTLTPHFLVARRFLAYSLFKSQGVRVFDPSSEYTAVPNAAQKALAFNVTGKLCTIDLSRFFPHADFDLSAALRGDESDVMKPINMFTYRAWISMFMHRFFNSLAPVLTQEVKEIMTLIFYAVSRGGLEVTFDAKTNMLFFGGSPRCALQQYRVGSRVMFLYSTHAHTKSRYRQHGGMRKKRKGRYTVHDKSQEVLVNAYDIANFSAPDVHVGHGIDINVFSGEDPGGDLDKIVAHEAGVVHTHPGEGKRSEKSTSGVWTSRWHAWKSIGRFTSNADLDNEDSLELEVVLDQWQASPYVDIDTTGDINSIWRTRDPVHVCQNASGARAVWVIDIGRTATHNPHERINGRNDFTPQILTTRVNVVDPYGNSAAPVTLEWNYFVHKTRVDTGTARKPNFEYYSEVFVTDVSVTAGKDYWRSVWRRTAGAARELFTESADSGTIGYLRETIDPGVTFADLPDRGLALDPYAQHDGEWGPPFSPVPNVLPVSVGSHISPTTLGYNRFPVQCPMDYYDNNRKDLIFVPRAQKFFAMAYPGGYDMAEWLKRHASACDILSSSIGYTARYSNDPKLKKRDGYIPSPSSTSITDGGDILDVETPDGAGSNAQRLPLDRMRLINLWASAFGPSVRLSSPDTDAPGPSSSSSSSGSGSISGSQFGLAHCVEYLLPVETREYTLEDFK